MCDLSIAHLGMTTNLCNLSLEQKDVIECLCLSVCAEGFRLKTPVFGRPFAGRPKKRLYDY